MDLEADRNYIMRMYKILKGGFPIVACHSWRVATEVDCQHSFFKITVFWDVTLCILVIDYPEDRGISSEMLVYVYQIARRRIPDYSLLNTAMRTRNVTLTTLLSRFGTKPRKKI
jgi:hypothetical protein